VESLALQHLAIRSNTDLTPLSLEPRVSGLLLTPRRGVAGRQPPARVTSFDSSVSGGR
jgi:hypothetical protein